MGDKPNLQKTDGSFYEIVSPFTKCSIGIAGKEANIIDYSHDDSMVRQEEKNLLAGHTGIGPDRILFLNQMGLIS